MKTFLLYIKGLIQLIMSPVKAWEDASYDNLDPNLLLTRGLVPLLVIMMLSVGMTKIYHPLDASWFFIVEKGVIFFLVYFVTYFLAHFFLGIYMPLYSSIDNCDRLISTLVVYGVGLQALFVTIQNCLPVNPPILRLLPLFVLFVLWRGTRYLAIKFDYVASYAVVCFLTIVLPPMAVDTIFSLI